jgi:hypothetical protein
MAKILFMLETKQMNRNAKSEATNEDLRIVTSGKKANLLNDGLATSGMTNSESKQIESRNGF